MQLDLHFRVDHSGSRCGGRIPVGETGEEARWEPVGPLHVHDGGLIQDSERTSGEEEVR